MPAETSFVKAKYALAADEVKAFPGEVSEPGAKSFDKFIEEHTLTYKAYSGAATLKSGELAEQKKAGETFTLPAVATANQLIGVFCGVGPCKVTTSGGALIFGDFIGGEATVTLLANQHVLLQSSGTAWLIIAGEPKRTALPGAQTVRAAATPFEPSATRPTFVSGLVTMTGAAQAFISAESLVAEYLNPAGVATFPIAFICQPGVSWKWTKLAGTVEVQSVYLTL